MTSIELNSLASTGVTPQLRFSFLQAFSSTVIPTISVGQRKRLTIRAVFPETEQTTIALAFTSIAMAQVAWEMASRLLLMRKSFL